MDGNPLERTPIDDESVWEAKDLLGRDDWQFNWSAAQLDEFDQLIGSQPQRLDSIEEVNGHDFDLPMTRPMLEKANELLHRGPGIVWIRGIPIEKYNERELQFLFWILSTHLGTPVPQTASGERLFHVRNEGLPDNHPKARGPSSNKRLTFHSDRCDVIGFLCRYQALSGGENEVVSSSRLFNEILNDRPDLADVLCRPFLYQRHNVDTGNESRFYEQPIFGFADGQFSGFLMRVLIDRAFADPSTPAPRPEQLEALDLLANYAEEERFHIRFRQSPGDLLWVNNLTTFHRRSAFEDGPTIEQRRQLYRIWLSCPTSRPLPESFRPTFGEVAAGSLRGGMRPMPPGAPSKSQS